MLALVVIAAAIKLSTLAGQHEAIDRMSGAEELVRYGGDTLIKRKDWIILILAPGQMSRWEYAVFRRSPALLWGVTYALGGLLGGLAACWLAWAGIRRDVDTGSGRVLPQLLSAAFAGGLLYLLLLLPAPLLRAFFSTDFGDVGGVNATGSIYQSLMVLSVLSGLFTATFFERLEGFFERILRAHA